MTEQITEDLVLTKEEAPKKRRAATKGQSLLEQIQNLSIADKAELGEILGEAGAIHKNRNPAPKNEAVSAYVLAHGDCQHADDFVPQPPIAVSELGEQAVKHFQNNWRKGQPYRSRGPGGQNEDLFSDGAPNTL